MGSFQIPATGRPRRETIATDGLARGYPPVAMMTGPRITGGDANNKIILCHFLTIKGYE